MNVLTAVIAVVVIGWAAAHPGGMVTVPSQVTGPAADCTVTTQHDVGPSDPEFEARLRAATERLCAALNKEGA